MEAKKVKDKDKSRRSKQSVTTRAAAPIDTTKHRSSRPLGEEKKAGEKKRKRSKEHHSSRSDSQRGSKSKKREKEVKETTEPKIGLN